MITSGCGNRLTYNVLSDVDKTSVVPDRIEYPLLSIRYGIERPGGGADCWSPSGTFFI